MTSHTTIAVAVAGGAMLGWLSHAQLVHGQGQQRTTPLSGQLSHISFAVADVEKTTRRFAEIFGIDSVGKPQDYPGIKWGPQFPGKVYGNRRMGLTINGVSFEFLQPLPGDNPYSQFIAKGGEGVHHVGFNVPDVPKARDYLVSKGGVQTQEYAEWANYVDMHPAGLPITFEITNPPTQRQAPAGK